MPTPRRRPARLRALWEVSEPCRRGDYKAALKACEGLLRNKQPTASYCFWRGGCLSELGQLEEAEIWLRRSIELEDHKTARRSVSIDYSTLAGAMLESGRYDEAEKCLAASLRYFPKRSPGYRMMAELCLLRGDKPAQAVRWARKALACEGAVTPMTPELHRLCRAEILATLAWAKAVETHKLAAVMPLADVALATVGDSSVQSTAEVLYHAGRAYAELGETAISGRYFRRAARLERQGRWGRTARIELAEMRRGAKSRGGPASL